MKRTISLLMMYIIGFTCMAKQNVADREHIPRASAGLDISSAIGKRHICIIFSHAVGQNWTVCGRSGFGIVKTSSADEDENAHEEGFMTGIQDSGEKDDITDILEQGISVQYWPAAPYRGVFLELGCLYLSGTRVCFNCGIGYSIRVSEVINIQMSAEKGLSTSYRQIEKEGYKIKLGICCTF